MKGLTPLEHEALARLTVAPNLRGVLLRGTPLNEATWDLLEQGRATYERFPSPIPMDGTDCQGRFYITAAGRQALALYSLMLALEAQR